MNSEINTTHQDSIAGLAWQCCTWMVSSPVVSSLAGGQHALEAEHLASRSYLPSAAGQAAYYQVLKHPPSSLLLVQCIGNLK